MNLMPKVTFSTERTIKYHYSCKHCPYDTLVRTDFVANIFDPMNMPFGLPKRAWSLPVPKPITPPSVYLTHYHCDNCKTQFDISVAERLTDEMVIFDSEKERWEKEQASKAGGNGG